MKHFLYVYVSQQVLVVPLRLICAPYNNNISGLILFLSSTKFHVCIYKTNKKCETVYCVFLLFQSVNSNRNTVYFIITAGVTLLKVRL